ncbi:MAG: hypothetical protein ACI4UL_06655 [Muribaculaceae bacterium]
MGGITALFCLPMMASGVVLKTRCTQVTLSESGYYQSIQVDGKEVLASSLYPLVTAGSNGKIILPKSMTANDSLLTLKMDDGGTVVLRHKQSDVCATLQVKSLSKHYDALVYGPVKVNLHETVGDVIGVAQGNGVAFGVQALDIKTNGGIVEEYGAPILQKFEYQGASTELSVASIPAYRMAAADTGDGAVLQLSVRKRDKDAYRQVMHFKNHLAEAVKGPDGRIEGSKIALFGCKKEDALQRIGEIEIEQGLPHPLIDGEWTKTSRKAMRAYLISDFNEQNLDLVLDKAEIAGLKYVYHSGPFSDWGHFNWEKDFAPEGDKSVKAMVDKARARGIGVGVHTLSNFMTTNDAYVTPVPSQHLLKQGILKLQSDISAEQTEIAIEKSNLFEVPMSINTLHINDELIQYGKVEETTNGILLKDCKRGAWGTKASAHNKKSTLYKLSDHAYHVLLPDLTLQDSVADRLSARMNRTGLCQVSFDGLEGCAYTGHEEYATSRFVTRCYNQWDNDVINDASRLNHNLWHIHTRMNWGEPWGEAMRTGQVNSRIKNQEFFRRNLFPRMLGWFLIRLADKKFECTTLEDLEWALSESAGFDAGYAMTCNTRTLKNHGEINHLMTAMRDWNLLREAKAFSNDQQRRLRDPQTEWHLEKQDEKNYLLYPLYISKRFNCDLNELQPGQPAGADWVLENSFAGATKLRLKVTGDGYIEKPTFTTPEGVITFPCRVESGQYLILDYDGSAVITDKNYNTLSTVTAEGNLKLSAKASTLSFTCEVANDDDRPDVEVRVITCGTPETVALP